MTEQEDKDYEKIRYRRFTVKKSENLDTPNNEITYKKFKGGFGNVNPNNEKITYKGYKGGYGNISSISSTRKTQNSQPVNVLNPRGFIGKCYAPNSISQAEKKKIMNTCKMTNFYDDSQYSEKKKNPAFQQLKKSKPFEAEEKIEEKIKSKEFKEEEKEEEIKVLTSLVANDNSKAKEMIDLTKFKFMEEELEFLREENIEFQDSDTKWSWLTIELAEKYFVSVLLPYYVVKSDLSYNELNQLGFNAFIEKIKRMKGLNYSELKNKYINLGKQNLTHFLIREFGKDIAEEKLINAKKRLSTTTYIIPQYVIGQNRLKLRIILDLGFSPIKCKKCDIGIDLLLALHLHHPTELKEISIRDIYAMPKEDYSLILEKFKKDKVQLLCSNHHREEHAFYPIEFKEIIFKKDLFSMSAGEIDVYIDIFLSAYAKTPRYVEIIKKQYIFKNKEVPSKIIIFWKFKIKQWIKKRFVFYELFDGKCVICGDSNLIHLDLHHLEAKKSFESWGSIKKFDCDVIMRLIVDEKCVCLCSNCHILITYKYHLSIKEVLKGFYPLQNIERISKELTLRYNNAIRKMNNFQYNLDKLDLRCPLKLDFPLGDIWKSDLMTVYYYLELKKRKFFFRNEILYDLELSPNFIDVSIRNLIDMNYIKRSSLKYFLTQEGFEKISELFQEYNEEINRTIKKIKKHLKNKEKYEFLDYVYSREDRCFVKRKKATRQGVAFKYCLIIFDLISEKGANEFTINDLIAFSSNKNYSTYRYAFLSILAPLGLIEEVDEPISYERENKFIPGKERNSSKILISPTEVVYRLTKKGFDIIEYGLDAL